MPKLRQNIITGDWVVISPERAKRPEDFVTAAAPKRHLNGECPFCLTNPKSAYQFSIKEAETKNIYVIPNKYPAFVKDEDVISESGDLYFSTKSIGAHEVIILKDHEKDVYDDGWQSFNELFGVYIDRYKFHNEDPSIEYIMPIHNHGPEAAASIDHPHSQLFASSIIPSLVEEELKGSQRFYRDKGKCVFCAMIEEEKKQGIRIVAENEDFICFTFFASRFPFEMWAMPKKHQAKFTEITLTERENFSKVIFDAINKLNSSIKFPPFNWWIHSTPARENHIEDLNEFYHWHMEIAPRVSKFGGYEMGSGIVIDVVSPELAAQFLKKV